MKDSRIEALLAFIKEDPLDAFSHFALALEYKEMDPHKYFESLKEVNAKFPTYEAVYYPLAEAYIENEQFESAKNTFIAGLALLEQNPASKAYKELLSAYELFQFEYDV